MRSLDKSATILTFVTLPFLTSERNTDYPHLISTVQHIWMYILYSFVSALFTSTRVFNSFYASTLVMSEFLSLHCICLRPLVSVDVYLKSGRTRSVEAYCNLIQVLHFLLMWHSFSAAQVMPHKKCWIRLD